MNRLISKRGIGEIIRESHYCYWVEAGDKVKLVKKRNLGAYLIKTL